MKKCCWIIPLLLLVTSVMGQKRWLSINYKPSVSYVGRQQQQFNHYYITSCQGKTSVKQAVSVMYHHQLNTKWAFAGGVEYGGQGQNIRFNTQPGINAAVSQVDFIIQLEYLRLPLLISYTLLSGYNSSLSVHSGISPGIATIRNDNYNNIILEAILLPPAEKRYQKIDVALPLGIHFRHRLAHHLHLHVGAEYLRGLTNCFSNNPGARFGVLSSFNNSRLSRLSIITGFILSLDR